MGFHCSSQRLVNNFILQYRYSTMRKSYINFISSKSVHVRTFSTKRPVINNNQNKILYVNTLGLCNTSFKSGKKHLRSTQTFYFEDEQFLEENSLPPDQWQTIIHDQLNKNKHCSKLAFDTSIMEVCLSKNNVALANSYVSYLETRKEKLNFVALGFYLIILAKNFHKIDEETFLNTYEELRKEKYLPYAVTANIIHALSLTKFWHEAIQFVTLLETDYQKVETDYQKVGALRASHNFIVMALAREKGFDSAYEYLTLIQKERSSEDHDGFLHQETITSLLASIKPNSSEECKDEYLVAFYKVLQKYEQPISERNVQTLSAVLSSHWKSSETKITNRGICGCCGSKLSLVPLSQSEFNSLKREFEVKTVKGSDIFQKTTPDEWDRFRQFLKRNAPFDMILDGLNMVYFFRDKYKTHKFLHFLSQQFSKGKILIIFPSYYRKNIRNFGQLEAISNVYFYFPSNLSKDDVFILYAALYSGFGCKFITSDYLRDHKYLLEDHTLKKHFLYWQKLNQMLFHNTGRTVILKHAYQYHRSTQWDERTQAWHIPLEERYVETSYIESANLWLCVQKKL